MRHILLIFCLSISCSLFAQKKIKNSIVLSTNDTISINDIIILKKGIAINNTFQFVRTRSNFNVPSQYEGSQQKISFFKEIDNKYYAYTFNFLVNLEEALNNGEITISGLEKNKITPPSSLIDTIIPSSPIILYTLTDILSNIPWYKTQQEINNFYSKNLKNIPKSSFGKDGYSESYLSDIVIGNYGMRMDLVINNATQTLTRVTLKPLFKLTDKNSNIIRDSINNILKNMFGEPLTAKIDSSIKVHSAITKWLTDDYSIESVFMGHKDFQVAAIGVQPIDRQKTDQELNTKNIKLTCIVVKDTYLSSKPDFSGEKIINVQANDTIILLDITSEGYLYVAFRNKNGYLLRSEVSNSNELEYIFKSKMMFHETESQKQDSIVIDSLKKQIKIKDAQYIRKFGKEFGTLILQKKVKIGMTSEMCIEAWGIPLDKNKTIGSWGTHEQWIYENDCYLYFENGILTTIQN